MKTYDFNAVYYHGDCFCVECCSVDEEHEDVIPIFADSEEDTFPTCVECGEVHTYMSLLSIEPTLDMLREYVRYGYGNPAYLDPCFFAVSGLMPYSDLNWKHLLAIRRYGRKRERENWK